VVLPELKQRLFFPVQAKSLIERARSSTVELQTLNHETTYCDVSGSHCRVEEM